MAAIACTATTRRTVVIAVAAAAAAGVVTPLAVGAAWGATTTVTHVTGTWQELVPVLTTQYRPSGAAATTGTYTGVGSTLWRGTWTGVTTYTIDGVGSLVTGAGSGTINETFTGRTPDGASGTLGFLESYVVDAAGHIRIDARIVRSSGDFTGSRGEVTFTGSQLGAASGDGTFSGTWVRPRHTAPGGFSPTR